MVRWLIAFVCLPGCLIPEKQRCDGPGCPWSAPTKLAFSNGDDDHPTLNDDMTEMYFARASDIYVTTRVSVQDPWSTPEIVKELSTSTAKETSPELGPDGNTIYYASDANGGQDDILMATRTMRGAPWVVQGPVSELNSPSADDKCATPSRNSGVLVIASGRNPGQSLDLFMSIRPGSTTWETPMALARVNTSSKESGPFLSSDLLTLYFYTDRPDNGNTAGKDELYESKRTDNDADFPEAKPIAELNTPDHDEANPWVSADDNHMFFSRDNTLYEAAR
jgi:WD40-like Beta Propeller Repeat